MINSVVAKKMKSSWRTGFHFMLVVVILGVIIFFWLKVLTSQKNSALEEYENTKTAELDVVKKKFWSDEMYEKYNYAELINKKYHTMPWSERINLIVEKVKELKDMSYEWSNAIVLSDFTVTLDKLSLKWEVSNLILLYRSSKNKHFISLIEMFQDLNFVDNVEIRTYKNNWTMIEFVLDANLTLANGDISE